VFWSPLLLTTICSDENASKIWKTESYSSDFIEQSNGTKTYLIPKNSTPPRAKCKPSPVSLPICARSRQPIRLNSTTAISCRAASSSNYIQYTSTQRTFRHNAGTATDGQYWCRRYRKLSPNDSCSRPVQNATACYSRRRDRFSAPPPLEILSPDPSPWLPLHCHGFGKYGKWHPDAARYAIVGHFAEAELSARKTSHEGIYIQSEKTSLHLLHVLRVPLTPLSSLERGNTPLLLRRSSYKEVHHDFRSHAMPAPPHIA